MKTTVVLLLSFILVVMPVSLLAVEAKDLNKAVEETKAESSALSMSNSEFLQQIAIVQKKQTEVLQSIDFSLNVIACVSLVAILAGTVIVINNSSKK